MFRFTNWQDRQEGDYDGFSGWRRWFTEKRIGWELRHKSKYAALYLAGKDASGEHVDDAEGRVVTRSETFV